MDHSNSPEQANTSRPRIRNEPYIIAIANWCLGNFDAKGQRTCKMNHVSMGGKASAKAQTKTLSEG